MSTNIKITVDQSSLTLAVKLIQEAARKAQQQKKDDKKLEDEATKAAELEEAKRVKNGQSLGQNGAGQGGGSISDKRDAQGKPLFGSKITIPTIDRRPVARRRGFGFPHVFWAESYEADPLLATNGKTEFTIVTGTGVRKTVEFTHTIPPNDYYIQYDAPDAGGSVLFMSGSAGPRVNRSMYNQFTGDDGDGSGPIWSAARPNNAGQGGAAGDSCRSYWNNPSLTDGNSATTIFPPFPFTSCSAGYEVLGLRVDTLGITRTVTRVNIAFALPLSADALVFICGIAEASDEGVITSGFAQTDGWFGPDQLGASTFGILSNRDGYLESKVPAASQLQLKAYIVRKTSIEETVIGMHLTAVLQSLLSSFTSETVSQDVSTVTEIDWRLDIQGSGITPFPQYVNPGTGSPFGSRTNKKITDREAFSGNFNIVPFFQANLFQYGIANLAGPSKQGFNLLQHAAPISTADGAPDCFFTSPSVFTYIDLYKNGQFNIDTVEPSQSRPLGLTLEQSKALLIENNVQPPAKFFSLLKEEDLKMFFAEWKGELPEGVGFPSADQPFSVYSEGWFKPVDDPGFRPMPRTSVITRPQEEPQEEPGEEPEEELFFHPIICWDWGRASYCKDKLVQLGFFSPPPPA